jgi:hypothetical protein
MIEWFLKQTWLIEGLITIGAGVVVVTVVYFCVERFKGE